MASDERMLADVRGFLQRAQIDVTEEAEEEHCKKLGVRSAHAVAFVSVYSSRKIVIGGKDTPLKTLLTEMKAALEGGASLPGGMLPFEIDRFPTVIGERVPEADPVIIRFIEEAIKAFRADALLSAAFMLGAASERAVNILIETFATAIGDESNRERFKGRIAGQGMSKRFDRFKDSYNGCQSKPNGELFREVDVVFGTLAQFFRVTRNDVGHPQIVPDLDRGVLLANLGTFVTYVERLYALINHFKVTPVVL